MKEQAQGSDLWAINGAGEGGLPPAPARLSSGEAAGAQGLLLPADVLSEEPECVSPDDISLPPLPGSPDSPLAPSAMELEEHASPSLSLHMNRDSVPTGSGPGEAQGAGLPPPAAFADTCNDKRETFSSHFEKPYPQLKAEPPLTSRGFLGKSTVISRISATHPESMRSGVHESACQPHPQAREGVLGAREEMHAESDGTKTQRSLHASQDAISGLAFQLGPSRVYQRPAVPQEEIKSTSAKNSVGSLAGQAPNFSRLLSNVTVVEGSPVTLEVEVTGFPEPALTWWVAYNDEP